ncbi:hypothetical protein D3P09_08765 [Paenibacillus pinisoli]|uniref:Uncharacterized protein n=1 Tax=Paenibacillus pinisoli TaxID=1276110 RepID=A0A3A6PEY6_9BACL|nr:hypothetical protein [Paenibacillus pinisoli]RJX39507.1 hypothetical protein D3P09_08765 [Paenibacillus pinisoli]
MEAVIFMSALFGTPIIAFLFSYLFLDMLFKDKYDGQKFLTAILFAILAWIFAGTLILLAK